MYERTSDTFVTYFCELMYEIRELHISAIPDCGVKHFFIHYTMQLRIRYCPSIFLLVSLIT
jgi:hypothetical protein